MQFIKTVFEGLYLIEHNLIEDDRGWFMRTFDVQIYNKEIPNLNKTWKQVNHSHNSKKGTFRGLHFQKPPFEETKLIRCISGSVIDFALDIRKDSNTFLKVFKVELSAENKKSLLLPRGFAHGFYTLQDNSDLLYFHDEFYNSEFDSGIYFSDPSIIDKIDISPLFISEKDLKYKKLNKEFKGI
jgi:dTDP-4-dehydrorhamnose 3,5-epimerase